MNIWKKNSAKIFNKLLKANCGITREYRTLGNHRCKGNSYQIPALLAKKGPVKVTRKPPKIQVYWSLRAASIRIDKTLCPDPSPHFPVKKINKSFKGVGDW